MKYFNPRLTTLLSSKAIFVLLGTSLVIGNGVADELEPNTYTDVPVPQLTDWNKSNVLTVDDGVTEQSYIYESVAAKEAAEGGGDPELGSVGAIFWELDNGTGRAPGIQAITDDLDFPTNNCIMASGEIESKVFPGTILPKTCTDPQGSSKRYKFEITTPDAPVDLVFDLGVKDIRYKGVKDPADDGGVALAEFKDTYGFGRIYRVIQKVINNTDERIAGYKFELGTGIGADFQPLTFQESGVGFEMRPFVPREFFDGETGAPDIEVWDSLRFGTMSPKMFDDGARARFEPGFLDHAAAGFLPPQIPADDVEKSKVIDSGLAVNADGYFGSMTPNYFDVGATHSVTLPGNLLGYLLPDSLIPTVIGVYSTNEVGGESDAIVAIWDGTSWRSGRAGLDGDPATTADNFGIIPLAQLEQWAAKPLGLELGDDPADPDFARYEGILSDDLSGMNTDFFIYVGDKLQDDTGALTLSSITLRVTANSVVKELGTVPGDEEPEWMKAGQEPPTLASYMVPTGTPVAINDITTTVENDPSDTITIDVLANDLLDGAPVVPADGFITITTGPADGIAAIINSPADEKIEYTPTLGFVGTDFISYTYTLGTPALPGTVSNIATIKIIVDAAPVPDQPMAVSDSAVTFEGTAVTLDVLANDELNNDAPNTVVVSINNDALNGVAGVEDDNTIIYTPGADFVGFERFTYVVTVDGIVSNSALVTIRVDEPVVDEPVVVPPIADDDSGSSSGCSLSYNPDGTIDPLLPGIVLISLIYLGWRSRRKDAR